MNDSHIVVPSIVIVRVSFERDQNEAEVKVDKKIKDMTTLLVVV